MSERIVNVHLYDPETGTDWSGQLPASTEIDALTDLLYEKKLKAFQPVGYGYVVKGHLCNNRFPLAAYMPEDADAIEVRIFAYPQVLQG